MKMRVLVMGGVAALLAGVAFDAWWQLDVGTPGPMPATPPATTSPASGALTAPGGAPAPAPSVSGPAAGTPAAPAGPLPLPPTPPRIAQGSEYERCLAMVPIDPAGANALADAWEATGGGDGAAHCHAAAQIALGNAETGAELMEKLARASKASALARAAIYGQATQAWLMAGDAARAYGSATMALSLAPDDVDYLIDRSIAAATMERYMDAIDDLNLALDRDPRRADALVFRAASWRHEGQLGLARDDAERALAIDPDYPDALLERGILLQRRGELAGARADWQRVLELAPDSATADLAQQNLTLLDAGPGVRQ
jgi:tetratricopeptide (TPR) repeat protein